MSTEVLWIPLRISKIDEDITGQDDISPRCVDFFGVHIELPGIQMNKKRTEFVFSQVEIVDRLVSRWITTVGFNFDYFGTKACQEASGIRTRNSGGCFYYSKTV